MLGEHGLSFLIETERSQILFDTGAGQAFAHNAVKAGIKEESVNSLVLSHGHYDHSGGICVAVPYFADDVKAYLHPTALEKKYSKRKVGFHYIGISKENRRFLEKLGENMVLTESPAEVEKDVWVSGRIPRINEPEKSETRFFLDEEGISPDNIDDDQSMFFKTSKGTVLLAGCCHSGLANTLDYISGICASSKVYAVIGGMHLAGASKERIDFTIDALKKYGVRIFAPCHCTGQISSAKIYAAMPDSFQPCHAGTVFEFCQ